MANPLLKVSSCKSLDANSTGLAALIRTASIVLENEAPEYLSHLFKGRVLAKLRHGQNIGSFSQLADLVVVRKFKPDFHLMDRHRASLSQASEPVPHEPLIDGVDRFIVRLIEGFARQVKSAISKYLFCTFCHVAIVAGADHDWGRSFQGMVSVATQVGSSSWWV